MRVYHQLTVLCLCLLASSVVSVEKSLGEFTEYDLKELEKIIHAVAKQKNDLKSQVSRMQTQKEKFKARVADFNSQVIPALDLWQSTLDGKLLDYAISLKALTYDMEAKTEALAGETVVTNCQEAALQRRWERINQQVEINNQQAAHMAKMTTSLKDISESLHAQLADGEADAEASISQVTDSAQALANFVNIRHCSEMDETIFISAENGTGSATINIPAGFFGRRVPLTYCSMRGFETNLDVGKSKAFRYEDLFKGTGVTVTCEPYADRVVLNAYDNSKGSDNAATRAYVNAVFCSMGPRGAADRTG